MHRQVKELSSDYFYQTYLQAYLAQNTSPAIPGLLFISQPFATLQWYFYVRIPNSLEDLRGDQNFSYQALGEDALYT